MLARRHYLAGAAVGTLVLGIAANAIYDLSRFSLSALMGQFSALGPAWLILFAAFILVISYLVLRSRLLYVSWSMANRLTELDDSLLRLLPSMVHGSNLDRRLKRVLEEFLRDCADILGKDLQRAMLLVPRGCYLVPWAGYEMSEKTMRSRRFYIGTDDATQLPGTAGCAFQEHRLRVVNLREQDGQWLADDRNYVVFDRERPHPPYQTFAAVPLLWEQECLGVICFDSNTPGIFDSERTKVLLYSLGRRAAVTILLYQRLNDIIE